MRTMRTRRVHGLALLALLGLVVCMSSAAATTLSPGRPVIGRPVATPTQAVAGKPLSISFRVTDRATSAPLLRGRLVCDPSVSGKTIPHAESFRGGTAKLSFRVPPTAGGKQLKVRVTIVAAGGKATRVSVFSVQGSGSTSAPALSIADAQTVEGNAGVKGLLFPVTLSAPATAPVSVSFSTADGTAATPADYAVGNGTLTIAPGRTSTSIKVDVVGDLEIEPDETFTVSLKGPAGATLARATATGTITNDDTSSPVTAGNYKGATQNANYVFFTVTPERTVTGFRINSLPETCTPYGGITGSIDWTRSTFKVGADGSFHATGAWKGSDVDGDVVWTSWTAELDGRIQGGSAHGTVIVKDELTYKGEHLTCSSGIVTWTASVQ